MGDAQIKQLDIGGNIGGLPNKAGEMFCEELGMLSSTATNLQQRASAHQVTYKYLVYR
jgi:hypothetical protein